MKKRERKNLNSRKESYLKRRKRKREKKINKEGKELNINKGRNKERKVHE